MNGMAVRATVTGAGVAAVLLWTALPASADVPVAFNPGSRMHARADGSSLVIGTVHSGDRTFAVCVRPEEHPPGTASYDDLYLQVDNQTSGVTGWILQRDQEIGSHISGVPDC